MHKAQLRDESGSDAEHWQATLIKPLLARLICTSAKLDANTVHVRGPSRVQRFRSVEHALHYFARVDEIVRAAPV
jgi:hypothetical protein